MPLNDPCFPKKSFKSISPDLVLHKGQSDNETENQVLVCEVKMEGAYKKTIERDLRKLVFLLNCFA